MEVCKKVLSVVCVAMLIVTLIGVSAYNAKAADYSSLSYKDIANNNNTEFDQKLKGAQYAISSGINTLSIIQFQNQAFSELYLSSGDWKADGLKATINGSDVTTEGAGIRLMNASTLLTKQYNELAVTWNGGEALIIVKCPGISGGQGSDNESTNNSSVTTNNGEQGTTNNGGQVTTNNGGQVTTNNGGTETTSVPSASSLPAKTYGVSPQVKAGEYTIDNSVLLAWSSVMEQTNANYDASVYAYNAYVYRDGELLTKVCNVTNGCILGGLAAGTYKFGLAAVNAKGEGPMSDLAQATVTGANLDFTPKKEYSGPKIPEGFSLTSAQEEFKSNTPTELQTNTLWVAWAASNGNPETPGYDPSVTGYNVYVFEADTGKPYRRVHIDGASENTAIIKNVSAGRYVCFVTAENANGESGMAAPGISLASSVEIEGEVIDNAQEFEYPDQPNLPLGLVINGADDGVGDGFSIAWSMDADLTGIRLNVYVDGYCIKTNANQGADPTYHEMRLAPGEYTVEVKSQFISNNVESFPLVKKIKVVGTGKSTPKELADSSYQGYEEESTEPITTINETGNESENDTTTITATTKPVTTTQQEIVTTKPQTTVGNTTSNENKSTVTTKAPVTNNSQVTKPKSNTNVTVAKSAIRKATKKKSAKKAKIILKKVAGATKYQIKYGLGKKMKKAKSVFVSSTKVTLKGLKKKKTYYVMVRTIKDVGDKAYGSAWSSKKKIRMK